MIWAPYKQQVAQAGPAGRMVGAGPVAGKAAWGQAGISGTKEPRLFLAEYLTQSRKILQMGVGGKARSKSQKMEGKADACLGQYLN